MQCQAADCLSVGVKGKPFKVVKMMSVMYGFMCLLQNEWKQYY